MTLKIQLRWENTRSKTSGQVPPQGQNPNETTPTTARLEIIGPPESPIHVPIKNSMIKFCY